MSVQQTQEDVIDLASEEGYSLDELFKSAKVATTAETTLNERQKGVVAAAMVKIPPSQWGEDIVVDVAIQQKYV